MPARKILRNYISVTGLQPSRKAKEPEHKPFESTLERDFYSLLEFDPGVLDYEPQPVRIDYEKPTGRSEEYYPDTLVRYRPSTDGTPVRPTTLFEVKPRAELKEFWADYRPGFQAAWRYALPRGWRFKLVTERELRTPLVTNVKFLLRFRTLPPNTDIEQRLLHELGTGVSRPVDELLAALWPDRQEQAQHLPYLWRLLATRHIETDLAQPLNMKAKLWNSKPSAHSST
jgi:hypothetical protein